MDQNRNKTRALIIFAFTCLTSWSTAASASDPSRHNGDGDYGVAARPPRGTVILRIRAYDMAPALFTTEKKISSLEEAETVIQTQSDQFVDLPTSRIMEEVRGSDDTDAWYFFWGLPNFRYQFPTFYWYGFYFAPYFSYQTAEYTYYYYRYNCCSYTVWWN